MKNKIIIFIFLVCANASFAQAGYQGHRSEISMDVFNLAYRGDLSFTYKFAIGRVSMIYLNYEKTNFKMDMNDPTTNGLRFQDQYSPVYYDYDDVQSGETSFKMSTFGFGYMQSNTWYGMNMPVGVYWALGLHFSSGEMTDVYTFKDGLPGTGVPIGYDVSQFNFRLMYGSEFVITGLLTMDISLALGYTMGTYTAQNTNTEGLMADNPFGIYPQITFKGHNYNDEWSSADYGYGNAKSKSNNVMVAPQIRIGYIF